MLTQRLKNRIWFVKTETLSDKYKFHFISQILPYSEILPRSRVNYSTYLLKVSLLRRTLVHYTIRCFQLSLRQRFPVTGNFLRLIWRVVIGHIRHLLMHQLHSRLRSDKSRELESSERRRKSFYILLIYGFLSFH